MLISTTGMDAVWVNEWGELLH